MNSQPVTLLYGMGGTGKTELAKAFARWLQETGWSEGSFFYTFEGGQSAFGMDRLLVSAGLALLGQDFLGKTRDASQRREIMLNFLRANRIVVILDNFETVSSDESRHRLTPSEAENLRSFLEKVQESAQSLILITSRSKEDWLGEINPFAYRRLRE